MSKHSPISELPEELMDMFLCELSSTDQIRAGTVCRRWHSITLPYIRHKVVIKELRDSEPLHNQTHFLAFLTGRPAIASLVRRLTFYKAELDILIITRFLGLLPQLRTLNSTWISLPPPNDTTQQPRPSDLEQRRFQLDWLQTRISVRPGSGRHDIAELQLPLAGLFSYIRQLSLDGKQYENEYEHEREDIVPPARDGQETFVSQAYSSRPSVDEVVVELGSVRPLHIGLLFQDHVFCNLTSLGFSIVDLEVLEGMSKVLFIAGDTLVELHASFTGTSTRTGSIQPGMKRQQ